MLGDRFVEKKGLFGHRSVAVDLSGTSGFVKSLIGGRSKLPIPNPMLNPQSVAPSGMPLPAVPAAGASPGN